jgi:hypothetical protein
MDEIRSDMLEGSMRDVMRIVVQESYEFSTFAVGANQAMEQLLESIMASEVKMIAD